MDTRAAIVCFLVVLTLVGTPISAENCAVVDDGGEFFCTKPLCKATCEVFACDRKGSLKDYHCEKKNAIKAVCYCNIC
ncbi:putative defensin-like protein 134 [Triticum dicoccoides]|uniref:putative defensin-like protein 134 n=1 Tax=Triticum dicoccoides TaxID=85692 RepID=UPI000E7BBB9F|nr:putative defensin-like protein 134 [Triticum dicoccoides]